MSMDTTALTLSLNKTEGKETIFHLDEAIQHLNELVADNDLSRADESIVDLEHARQLMRRAFSLINQYKVLF